jgi:[acyl-carrier-protein] S-malonyltransferase
MIVVVCPGQGSQTPGFFEPWLELPEFRAEIELMQSVSGIDLIGHGTVSDAETIRDTAVAQPLIVSASIASFKALSGGKSAAEAGFHGVAGHSVGEVAAAVLSGVFSSEQGISFVNARGQAMAKAAALETTSMAAIIGGEQADVEAKLAALDLEPANYNGSGQIVAAGSLAAISALQADAPASTRVIPLQVAGAFHTRYMKPAVAELQQLSESLSVGDPDITLWSNSNGAAISTGDAFLKSLISQVSSSVRWDLCMQAMVDASVTALIEVSPAGTLTGLAKRAMPGIELLALKTPESLDAARTLIANHR